MNKMLKNVIKTSVAFFIIGTGITLAAPYVAEAMFDSSTADTIKGSLPPAQWNGAFFAMFGGASAVVPPVVGKILGLNESQQPPQISIEKAEGFSVGLQPQGELDQASVHGFPGIEDDAPQQFTAKITAERSQAQDNTIA